MSKTINLELPDWADERVIHIMAGIERIAYEYPWDQLMIKTTRCSMCGKCCMSLGENHIFPVIYGRCSYLKKEVGDNNRWLCDLGTFRPHACCVTKSFLKRIPECTVKYESVS